nr:ankyrin repeat-containing protein ITN1-like [Tanacetum cinerariifolium]
KGKANGKEKDKQVYIPKPKNPKPSAKEHLAKDDTFHHCKEVGHCKRNYLAYLGELIKKKKQVGTAKNQLGKTIKALRSDRGGEYISHEFKDYLKACGIVQQLTPLYTPQHNGVSERINRTLLDMINETVEMQTRENLMEAGVLRSNGVLPKPQQKGLLSRTWARYVNDDQSWLEKQRGILILAALVVAGMAFHSGINPPGGTITNTQNGRYPLGNAAQTEVDMDQWNSRWG